MTVALNAELAELIAEIRAESDALEGKRKLLREASDILQQHLASYRETEKALDEKRHRAYDLFSEHHLPTVDRQLDQDLWRLLR